MANGMRWIRFAALTLVLAVNGFRCNPSETDAEVGNDQLEEVYAWKALDYAWPSQASKDRAIARGDYIPKNNAMVGVKIWGDRAYVAVPRWLPGVPATLNWVPSAAGEGVKGPLSTPLTPYPCWEMQEVGNCSAIQFVQSMEIDPLGRMWVLDVGRRNFFTPTPDNSCPPKLVLLDLKEGGRVLHTFVFPDEVASHTRSFLNDLVIDVSGGGNGSDWYAYISDAMGDPASGGGGIVVYHLGSDRAWRVADSASMNVDPAASEAIVGGRRSKLRANVDGIALTSLSEGADKVFYAPLGSFNLYTLPTSLLRDPPADPTEISSSVIDLGRRISQGDGMAVDSTGALYFGLLAKDGFARWTHEAQVGNGDPSEAEIVAQDSVRLQWVDSFGFDSPNKSLFVVSNRLQNLQLDDVNLDEVNYRLFRIKINARSYMYPD
nr:yellow-x2 protein [Ischnura senegalensis]